MSNTILYAAEALHNERIVHVMGYQNRASNLDPGPNAMLLPIPTDRKLGPENTLDMRLAKNVLTDYAKAVRPVMRGTRSKGFGSDERSMSVQVFDSGSYTIVLAQDAREIPSALDLLPENKRPRNVHTAIFDAYASWYRGWPLALCAWDGSVEAEPMVWWYEPKDASRLFLPALDGHDGNVPDLNAKVAVDHTVIVGSVTAPSGHPVRFQDEIPASHRPFFAPKVAGSILEKLQLQNGDFTISLRNVAAANSGAIQRVLPPGV